MDIINKPRKTKEKQVEKLPEDLTVLETEELQESLSVEEPLKVTAEIPVFELTHTAIGSFQDGTGQWRIVKIPYNPIAEIVGNLEIELVGPEKAYAIERFKIEAVKNKLV